jgi:hypothetical protein
MSNLFSQHVDLLLGALISVITGFGLGYFFHRLQRQPKTLDWELVANQSILGAGKRYIGESRLTVLWDGMKLSHPRLVTLRIVNSGKREIELDDYERPVNIFSSGDIIDAIITGSGPNDLFPTGSQPPKPEKVSPHELEFSPGLLNAGDWIELQLVVDGEQGRPVVSTRFAGQSRSMRNLQEVRQASNNRWGWFALGIAIMSLGGMFIFVYPNREREGVPIAALFFTISALVSVISLRWLTGHRRRVRRW